MNKLIGARLRGAAFACGWIALAMTPGVLAQTTAFVHRATSSNIENNWTVIDHAATNGHPEAVVIITANYNPGGAGGVYDAHSLGVWYTNGKWAIFHQDRSAMIVGAAFNVLVASPSGPLRLLEGERGVLRRPGAAGRRAEAVAGLSGGTAAGAPARRVLPDGSAEIVYPDRTKVQASSGMTKITRPDGTESARMQSQTQAATPPIPTDELTRQWLERHGEDLLSIMLRRVTDGDASIQNYLHLEGPDLSLYSKINKRRSTIFNLLTSP
jgi:hypothetical protein